MPENGGLQRVTAAEWASAREILALVVPALTDQFPHPRRAIRSWEINWKFSPILSAPIFLPSHLARLLCPIRLRPRIARQQLRERRLAGLLLV